MIVSVASPREVSGQGRALARLTAGPPGAGTIFMCDGVIPPPAEPTRPVLPLRKPQGRVASLLARRGWATLACWALAAETIRRRAAEVGAVADAAFADILVGCSGNPYDLAATAFAARRAGLPFAAYLFDDPIAHAPAGPGRTVAAHAVRWWLPLAAVVVVANEELAQAWRRRGARRVAIVPDPDTAEAFWSVLAEATGARAPARPARRGGVLRAVRDAAYWLAALPRLLRPRAARLALAAVRADGFDRAHYRRTRRGLRAARRNPAADYVARGWRDGAAPNALFDPVFYLRQCAGDPAAAANPFGHFVAEGWRRGLDPGPFFATRHYLAQAPALAGGDRDPLSHYARTGAAAGLSPCPGWRLPAALDLPPDPPGPVRFAVIVPCYNHGDLLPAALDSLIAQDRGDWEAVVVDDGSSDATPAVAAAYAARDPRIRVLRTANRGTAAALNAGIAATRAPWVMWLSADDAFLPDKMAATAAAIAHDPGLGLVHADYRVRDAVTGAERAHGHAAAAFLPAAPQWQTLAFLRANVVHGLTVAIRRGVLAALGGFRAELRLVHDFDLWMRASRCVRFAYIARPLAVSTTYFGQASLAKAEAVEAECIACCRALLKAVPFGALVPALTADDPDRLRAAADAALSIAADPGSFVARGGLAPLLLARIAAAPAAAARAAFRQAVAQTPAPGDPRKAALLAALAAALADPAPPP